MKKADRNYLISVGVIVAFILIGGMLTSVTKEFIYLGLFVPAGLLFGPLTLMCLSSRED